MANVTDAYKISNVSATDVGQTLYGGLYGVACVGSNYGTVTLQALGPDGSTWLTALTAFAANGYSTANLAPGQYRFAISSATGVYASAVRIPS